MTLSETPSEHSQNIEVGSNVVALVKLPISFGDLAVMIERMTNAYGTDLRMMEEPKGWIQFFKP